MIKLLSERADEQRPTEWLRRIKVLRRRLSLMWLSAVLSHHSSVRMRCKFYEMNDDTFITFCWIIYGARRQSRRWSDRVNIFLLFLSPSISNFWLIDIYIYRWLNSATKRQTPRRRANLCSNYYSAAVNAWACTKWAQRSSTQSDNETHSSFAFQMRELEASMSDGVFVGTWIDNK